MSAERQEALLAYVIKTYIATAEPIGSKTIAEEGHFSVSAPTLRNDLRALEEAGYLTHPHTSAGRIPTERGFRRYVAELMDPHDIDAVIQAACDEMRSVSTDEQQQLKWFAKWLSEWLDAAVLIRFGPQELYYTGLSRLFAQPEFSGAGQALNLSRLFDECEERIPRYVEQMRQADGPQCLIGAENPLGEHCTSIGVTLGGEQDWKVFTLSPIRAPYERLIPLIECLTRYSFST